MGAITREDLAQSLVPEAEENGGLLGVSVLIQVAQLRMKQAGYLNNVSHTGMTRLTAAAKRDWQNMLDRERVEKARYKPSKR